MHQHLTNASLQVVPIVQDRHPYEWVDEAIALIANSGLSYTVGAFGTSVEGTYEEIRKLVDDINRDLFSKGCAEWLLNVQWQIRSSGNVTEEEKVRGR